MLEDRRLIWRFNRGDRDAFRRIYQKYRDHLLKVTTALLNDRSGVEDVVHDVFVAFAQNAGHFQLRGSLKGYLSVCVANHARDANRAVLRQAALDSARRGRTAPHGRRPDDSLMQDEQSSVLGYALSQLPYEQREVVVLHIQGNMRFGQIAKLKGVSVNTVMSRYRYATKRLRSILDGELKP